MLCNIDHSLVEDARRILTLLCFASRPLTVREIIDGVAVEINNSKGLNRKRRLQDSNDIREICVGFIDIGLGTDHTTETHHEEELTPTVRIAHFSVQEYLESERIRHQKAVMFSLASITAHAEIAQICLTYLLEHGLSSSNLDQNLLEEFPLAKFAAMYWYHHYQTTAKHDPGLEDSILKLFQRQNLFATWVKLHDMDRSWDTSINFGRTLDDIPAPVYYASLLGLDQALHDLVNNEQLESTNIPALSPTSRSSVSKNINAQGGEYGNALQAASYRGHEKVVQILLDKGADINAQGGRYGNALQAASYRGDENVVRLLLNHGAVVNRKDIQGRTPFHLASAGGRMKTVEILSSFGSDPNVIDTQGRDCLHHAASRGSVEIVNWLLEVGFDPNYTDRDGWTSLHWAAKNGSVNTIEILKAAGARSTVEAIEGWTPDSVFIFHHNNPSPISRENSKSELAAKRSISSSAAVVELTHDERKVSPGIWQNGCYCDGCLLVSFDLNNLLEFLV